MTKFTQSARELFFARKLTSRHVLTKRVVWLVSGMAGLAAIVGVSAIADANPSPAVAPRPAPLPVATSKVERAVSFARERTFTGVVKAVRTSELGFERTGRLDAVLVDEGDRVLAGQPLARLDVKNLVAKRDELTAQRSAAQAQLDELVAGPRKETIAAARAVVDDLKAQLELAELRYGRSEKLVEQRAISREEYDQRSLGLRSTQARLEAARQQLEELEAGVRPEKIAAQRAVVQQLDAALANLAVDLEESTLSAPFGGVVALRRMDEGAIVSPGTPVLRLVEDDQLEAWIGLPVAAAAGLTPDERYEIEINGRQWDAALRAVLPELDPATRTRTAVLRFSAPDGSVVPSQVVRITVTEPTEAAGFWLPTTALSRGSRGLWSVYVAEEQPGDGELQAVRRDVELLYTEEDRVLARGTLVPGEKVIVDGAHRLAAGQSVTLLN